MTTHRTSIINFNICIFFCVDSNVIIAVAHVPRNTSDHSNINYTWVLCAQLHVQLKDYFHLSMYISKERERSLDKDNLSLFLSSV